jgi:hypothetical protein
VHVTPCGATELQKSIVPAGSQGRASPWAFGHAQCFAHAPVTLSLSLSLSGKERKAVNCAGERERERMMHR